MRARLALRVLNPNRSAPSLHAGNLEELREVIETPDGLDTVNKGDDHGWTALMYASQEGKAEIVEYLISRGANVDGRAEDGNTALMSACRQAWPEIVQILLGHGANPNHRNDLGWTALMAASTWGDVSIVEMLLKAGADKSKRNCYGRTALGGAKRK